MMDIITKHKIVAILRQVPDEELESYTQSLYEGGIRAFEVSFTTDHASQQIDYMKRHLPADAVIGAGTILTERDAKEAEACGADFMLSPSVCQEVLAYCSQRNTAYMPGVFSPSDISLCLAYGFTVLKLFPANALTMGYIKSLKGPFPQADFVAVGGVSLHNASEYLKNGFVGVGIGSSLVDAALFRLKKWEQISSDIRMHLETLKKENLL